MLITSELQDIISSKWINIYYIIDRRYDIMNNNRLRNKFRAIKKTYTKNQILRACLQMMRDGVVEIDSDEFIRNISRPIREIERSFPEPIEMY